MEVKFSLLTVCMLFDIKVFDPLLKPKKVWSGSDVIAGKCEVSKSAGFYGWYFRNFPKEIPTANCVTFDGCTLLYIGIGQKSEKSTKKLCDRIKNHLKGNAYGSTLRLSVGCLLRDELKIQLRKVSEKTVHFGDGEETLSEWLAKNAFVVWMPKNEPWKFEKDLIQAVSPPLNLQYNKANPFHSILSAKRKQAKTLT